MATRKQFKAVVPWLLVLLPLIVTTFPVEEDEQSAIISNYPNTQIAIGDSEIKENQRTGHEEVRDPVIPAGNEHFKDNYAPTTLTTPITHAVSIIDSGRSFLVSNNVPALENFQEENRAFKYNVHPLSSDLLEDARFFSGQNAAIVMRIRRSDKDKKEDKNLEKKKDDKKYQKKMNNGDSDDDEDDDSSEEKDDDTKTKDKKNSEKEKMKKKKGTKEEEDKDKRNKTKEGKKEGKKNKDQKKVDEDPAREYGDLFRR